MTLPEAIERVGPDTSLFSRSAESFLSHERLVRQMPIHYLEAIATDWELTHPNRIPLSQTDGAHGTSNAMPSPETTVEQQNVCIELAQLAYTVVRQQYDHLSELGKDDSNSLAIELRLDLDEVALGKIDSCININITDDAIMEAFDLSSGDLIMVSLTLVKPKK